MTNDQTMNSKQNRKIAFDDLMACPSCDLLHYRQKIKTGTRARCTRCKHELYTRKPFSVDRTLAATLAGLIFLLLSVVLPFLSLSRGSITSDISVLDTGVALWNSDMRWLGVVSLTMIAVLPSIRMGLLAWVMLRLRYRMKVMPSMRVAMRWAQKLEPWAMAEIFIVGVAVSLVKVSGLASLSVGPAFWSLLCLIGATILISIYYCKDSVWQLLTTHSE